MTKEFPENLKEEKEESLVEEKQEETSNKVESNLKQEKNNSNLVYFSSNSKVNNDSDIQELQNEESVPHKQVEDVEESFHVSEEDLKRLESLSDDEAILELDKLIGKNDSIIEKDYLSSLIEQGDRTAYFHVDNIYSNEDKRIFKNRLKLRRDPPVLVIRDDFGNEVDFQLTENLTDELSETLRQVKRAYYGFHKPSELNKPEGLVERVKYYIKSNPFKILTTIFLILFILSLNIL